MIESRSDRRSPKATASFFAMAPIQYDGLEGIVGDRRGRSRWPLGVATLAVCLALLLVGWPMRAGAQSPDLAATRRTGVFPDGVAINALTNKAYVANPGSNSVSVIDGVTGTASTLAAGTTPHAVVVNSVTNKIYVANEGSSSVTVIDGATNDLVSVAIGLGPHAMAVNSLTKKIYVANEGSASVTVIDGANNATTTIAVGNLPGAVAVNEATDKIYVVNRCGSDSTCASAGSMTVIDGPTNHTIQLETGTGPGAVAVNPETNRIYVVNESSNTVSVFDGASNMATEMEVAGPAAIAVNKATNRIYVATHGNTLAVIDGANNAITIVSLASEATSLSLNPVTNQIYLLSPAGRSITVVDGATNIVNTLAASNVPISGAVNPVTNQFYVAAIDSINVAMMDGITKNFAAVMVNAPLAPSAGNQAPVATATTSADDAAQLNTIIAPIASPVSGTPTFTFTTASTSSATASGTQSVYFQVDSLEGLWLAATRSGDSFTGTASSPLSPGAHVLYAYTAAAQDASSTAAPHASGAPIAAQIFTVSPEALGPGLMTSLVPDTAVAGGPAFTMTVNGSGFLQNVPSGLGVVNSVIQWNGSIRNTTFVSATELTVAVLDTDIQTPGTATVTLVALTTIMLNGQPVQNVAPVPDGTAGSISLPFTITSAGGNPSPTLTMISPTSATAGGATFTLTVTGTNFISSSVVNWNGAPLATTFDTATQLTATVPAADIASAGTASVTVFNPTPGGGTSSAQTFTINAAANNPSPTLTMISPTSATAGGAAFTLTVTGTNFISSSAVKWNGTALTTTFGSATQLTAMVPVGDIATAGTASVTVFNPTPGGGTSSALTFTINAAANNPSPTLTMISPTSATAGGAAFTLTVTGTNFVSSSAVKWNGAALTTTFGSATQLTAMVPVGDIATAGTASVTVFNPTPGGGTSSALTFTINAPANNPSPTLATLSPTSATAGGAAFTLTVTGTNFISASAVKWNGTALTTTFGSATQLTAMVPASDIASGGTPSVTVFNPTPGGGTSSALTFTVADFSLPNPPAPQTVVAGQTAMFTFATASVNGQSVGSLTFAASGLPAGAAATFTPTSVMPGTSTVMAVTTTARTTSSTPLQPSGPSGRGLPASLPMGLTSFLLVTLLAGAAFGRLGQKPARRWVQAAALALLIATAGYLAGCSNTPHVHTNGTPAGTYSITVTVSAGADVHTTTASLTVQ